MHFKGHIITNKIPTDDEILKKVKKYRESARGNKKFEWDWYEIGGRYGGRIKINFDPEQNEDNWYLFHDRNYKYFISNILKETKDKVEHYEELDYLQYMGLNNKILFVDGGYFNDMIEFDITDCYLVIDDNNELYVREFWNGNDWVENKEFDNEVANIDLNDKFITVIDFHN